MNELEAKRDELKKVSDACPKGSHAEVAEKVGFSNDYIYQIRTGRNATVPNKENMKLLQVLINEYRSIIRREQAKYANL